MSRERILLVVDALYVGGTETHILAIAKELIQKNIFVAIVANKTGNLINSFEALNCPIYHIEFTKTITNQINQETEFVREIEKIIDFENITHVHIHQVFSGFLAGQAAKNKGIPTILTIHGTYYPKAEVEKLLKLSDAVICVSPPLCDYVKELGIENPYLVPNGINLEDYPITTVNEEIRNNLNIPKDAIVVLYASRITWAKAHVCSILLRACKDLKLNPIPNLHVIVVGDGNRLTDVRALANVIIEMCTDNFIHIVGEQKDMHAYYSTADFVVGTGRVALEAMASEKQIIAVGNHGYFGVVNDENFEEAWAHYFGDHGSKEACSRHKLRDNLKKVLLDKEQLKINGTKLRKIVEEKFNIHKIGQDTLKIYSNTLKEGNKT